MSEELPDLEVKSQDAPFNDDGVTFDDSPVDNDEAPIEAVEPESGEPEYISDESDDLAPSEPEVAEENTDVDATQKAINKQHRKYREEERKRQAVEKELAELRASMPSQQEQAAVVVPPLPDAWEDDYELKMQQRDIALLDNARVNAANQEQQGRQQAIAQELQEKEQRALNERSTAFSTRAQADGFKDSDLNSASQIVAAAGITPDVASYLLDDDSGHLMVAYLADENNSIELYDLARSNPVQAGAKLSAIKAKATQLKRKHSKAPAPASAPRGKGSPPVDRYEMPGATFE